jgi:glycosyltransferase involved in cell wall biosynthesis
VRIFLHGNLRQLSSFSIINRRLIGGLRRLGHEVHGFASDDVVPCRANPDPPDVYLFNGDPWDARHAPGTVNVFALHYEYLSPDRELRRLVERLNAVFDLVLVPAPFVKPVLRAAGLRVRVEVLAWGYDPDEFGPRARPVRLADTDQFVFLHLGAANRRKGIDVLLRAYLAEFTAADDVVLVIKEAFRQASYEGWLRAVERRFVARKSPGAARLRWIRRDVASVAGYFTGADVGVFPHRGEAFGLSVLECIASGRPVIATGHSGPAIFCTKQNAWRVRASRVRRGGHVELEPDVRHLRQLMRRAYACGKVSRTHAKRTSATVRDFTWGATIDALDRILRRRLAGVRGRSASRPPSPSVSMSAMPRRAASAPAAAYGFHARGETSWRKVCTEIDRALSSRLPGYRAFTYRDRPEVHAVDIALGQSEHCLELLLGARRTNRRALAIVHQECTVLGDRVALVNRERAMCGLEAIPLRPIDFWRNRRENDLADHFIVASSVARRLFLENGFPASRVHVIPHGLDHAGAHVRRDDGRTRFLFVGSEPFCKGVRQLFAAWDRAALRNAELVCFTNQEVLTSKLLLRYLVRNPNIAVRPLLPHRRFRRAYLDVDCQVLPSLQDTFSIAVGDGMGFGKPAIVSTATGIQDLIADGANGMVVPAGDVDALASSLRYFAADRHRLRTMGKAASETARQYSWQRFRKSIGDLVESIWAARC